MEVIKNKLGEILHNCIIHPCLPFLPKEVGDKLHNWSIKCWSPWENLNEQETTSSLGEDEETEDEVDDIREAFNLGIMDNMKLYESISELIEYYKNK